MPHYNVMIIEELEAKNQGGGGESKEFGVRISYKCYELIATFIHI